MVAEEQKKIAMERVEWLFRQAEEIFGESPDLADRYVRLAWNIKTRYNLRLPRQIKLKFCRKCISFWRPGATSRVRKSPGRVTITCLKCGRVLRLPHPKKVNNG